ncbi:MAG: hypothetical protein QMD09_00405, partial [Desulfatibacillaceae bacterium]|nr:hypothetical protein [Desulfatibacillaceae bacterium]
AFRAAVLGKAFKRSIKLLHKVNAISINLPSKKRFCCLLFVLGTRLAINKGETIYGGAAWEGRQNKFWI